MKISECFPSKYLKAADIPAGRQVEVEVERVDLEEIDTSQHKPVVYFLGKNKGLVLNTTNANSLAEAFGDESDNWAGHRVVIYSARTTYMGRPTPCLRVRPIVDPAVPPASAMNTAAPPTADGSAPAEPGPADGGGSDIPF